MKSNPLDHPEDPLEAELKKLQPRAASDDLCMALERALREPVATSGVKRKERSFAWMAWGWGLAGVMVLVLAGLLWQTPEILQPRGAKIAQSSPLPSSANVRLVSQTVREVNDDGISFNADGEPVRQVRYLADETMRWRSPQTGAVLQISYPREETRLIPVSGN